LTLADCGCGWQKHRQETELLILPGLSPNSSALSAIASALRRHLFSWLRPEHELALEKLKQQKAGR
jgi:hypothetical protein